MKSLLFHLGLHGVEDIRFDQMAFCQRPMATNPSVNRDMLEPAQESGNKDVVTLINVVKEYAPRGHWKLFRPLSSPNFTCSRCSKQRKVRLVAQSRNRPHIPGGNASNQLPYPRTAVLFFWFCNKSRFLFISTPSFNMCTVVGPRNS